MVMRGTYIGEMSRLATLCSVHSHYADAIKSLSSLYLARGYPLNLVRQWTKDNFTARWQNRLTTIQRKEHDDLLVLKSTFNTAWNYFSAKELGDTVLGYWRGWLAAAESNTLGVRYPNNLDLQALGDTMSDLCLAIETPSGPWLMPDIRKIGFANKKLMVSRTRTRNLFDLTSLWKKTVLRTLEVDASGPDENMDLSDGDSSVSSNSDRIDPDLYFNVLGYRQMVY
jgi:hypothetical protein